MKKKKTFSIVSISGIFILTISGAAILFLMVSGSFGTVFQNARILLIVAFLLAGILFVVKRISDHGEKEDSEDLFA